MPTHAPTKDAAMMSMKTPEPERGGVILSWRGEKEGCAPGTRVVAEVLEHYPHIPPLNR